MITVTDYLMGRDKQDPLDVLQLRNMAELLSRVNHLLASLNFDPKISSGYRPPRINKSVGGAKMSTHTVCAGIDLIDPENKIGKFLKKNPLILNKYDLYLENPDHTPGWMHLDIKQRKNRIFNP
jgi:hypothetical protein